MLLNPKRLFVILLLSVFVSAGFTQSVQAAIISTEQVIAANASQQNRDKIAAALAKPEVAAGLAHLGVDKQEAQARAAALTDAQAAQLAQEIDRMPAAGSATWAWWILGIFLILVITDFFGWTHIFPWTKKKEKEKEKAKQLQ